MEQTHMQEECNEYERSRNARIAQNAAKLRALEIQDKVSSLIGHSESRKRSNKMKSKEKEKTNRYQEEDLEYISSHSEEEFDPLSFEVPKKVAQSSSQRRVRYIPPRSMTNFSSVAKRLAFQNQDLSINSHQRSPTECSDAERGQRHESNAASLSQKRNGNKMTMADLILEKKSTSRANEAATYQLDRTPVTSFDENGISTGPYTSSRAREVVQRESTCTISHDNALELNKSDSNTDNDDDVPFNYGQESEHSDDESTDEMLDLNGRDLELEAILNKKSRGPTMLHHVHMRPFEKRKAIILNEFGQPIGPISKEEDTVAEFSRFLGTIARDYDYAPIVVHSWRKIPNKEKMWDMS